MTLATREFLWCDLCGKKVVRQEVDLYVPGTEYVTYILESWVEFSPGLHVCNKCLHIVLQLHKNSGTVEKIAKLYQEFCMGN